MSLHTGMCPAHPWSGVSLTKLCSFPILKEPNGKGSQKPQSPKVEPPGESAVPALPLQAGQHQDHPGLVRSLFSQALFPPRQGRSPAPLQQLLPALGCCRSARTCPRGLQGWSC